MTTVDTGGIDIGPISQLGGGILGLDTITKTLAQDPKSRVGRRSKHRGQRTTTTPLWMAGRKLKWSACLRPSSGCVGRVRRHRRSSGGLGLNPSIEEVRSGGGGLYLSGLPPPPQS